MDKPLVKAFGDSAVLLSWKQEISKELNQQVRNADALINEQFAEYILETTFNYAELAIYLKPERDQNTIIENLRKLDWNTKVSNKIKNYLFQIPVCYSPEYGIDITALAETKGMSVEELIHLHTSIPFPVYFIGFLPGFPYLSELPAALHHPRLSTPRSSVPKGSVAIGGKQTGIYTMESPGGWNIIGRTPIELFDVQEDTPVFLKSGDQVQFVSISSDEFTEIRKKVVQANYQLPQKRLP